MQKSIEKKLPKITELFVKHHITRAYLFGSVLTDKFNRKSDVDFLVTIDPSLEPIERGGHLWDLLFELEALIGRKIDLLTEKSLKNPYFIEELNETKQLIYGKEN
jgi:uncharacterized protein